MADRKAELSTGIDALRAKRKACIDEAQKHEQALAGHQGDLAKFVDDRERACELEAQGQKNELAAISEKIATSSARARGCERLRDAKHAEARELDSKVVPLEKELRDISNAERCSREKIVIAAIEKQALDDIARRDALTARVAQAVSDLRSRDFYPDAKNVASDSAQKICRIANGLLP